MSSKSAPRRRQREALTDALETGRAHTAKCKPLIPELSHSPRNKKGVTLASISRPQ